MDEAVFAGWKGAPSVYPCPSVTFCCISDAQSSQSPEEVLALNAAAIIANIKLQRQLSRRTSSSVRSETDSSAWPQGNSGLVAISLHLCVIVKIPAGADAAKFSVPLSRFWLPAAQNTVAYLVPVVRRKHSHLCLVVVTADEQRVRLHPDGSEPQQQTPPHAACGPLAPDPWSCSLQVSSNQNRKVSNHNIY